MNTRKVSWKKSVVYNINYHLIFVTKYRKKNLKGAIADFLEGLLSEIAARRELKIISLSVQPDYVHLFIGADPFQLLCDIVKQFKGETGLKLFKNFSTPRVHLWKRRLWGPSYWVSTAGSISSETVKKYIEQQGST